MKKFVLFSFLILFLALSCVSAQDNSTVLDDNVCSPELDDALSVDQSADDLGAVDNDIKISTKNLVKYYKNDSQFEYKITDSKDKPVSNVSVTLKIKNVEYVKTTDASGSGQLKINLLPGKYVITTSCGDVSKNNTVNVLSRFSAKDVTSTYTKTATFSVKLLTKQGKNMAGELVTFKVGSKTYKTYTDSKGVAKINLKYNAGSYVIKYSADGASGKNKLVVKNYYKITTYKWGYGADVTKNKNIKKNIPNSNVVKKVITAAKSGIPVIKFQGGKGKTVFITSGVHGNELSSQVAAMQLIQYLETHPVKGTVYIMPFMNPTATSKNIRDYGVKLNSYANKKGTVSYKTVNLIVKLKCDAYGDFHCTRPGGKPGKNVAMGSSSPTSKSATLAKYISKNSKVKCMIYKKADVEYPGAMEDVVNLKHIPAVTCEVITPHGTIASGTVPISLSMMKSLLKFNLLI